ncbi:2Fe-2S iron-sulfur cluster-binding protein [Emcibacter nanhaiensis]|uniref:2Fe-2S iron-sulfur cluster binding domain-containing protein n=1 Tax=Emcibacter nanhaiensis TaxID=1505037 RepID=A0A501PK51_9PROT|nr:2Fe-2S iron-sulfur cluster-binding protein [Emcibacter nanhaiensis]TPD60645.1 2Fe-2S iron-sulfur cluster binding domain-containing protein [Emcibacter nanhaiensis]
MIKVTYIEFEGPEREISAAEDVSLMEAATQNDINGIDGDCGGACACATCHCYIDSSFLDRLPPLSETEDQLLDNVASPRLPNSRLGCQIKLSPELDGIQVRIPETQA